MIEEELHVCEVENPEMDLVVHNRVKKSVAAAFSRKVHESNVSVCANVTDEVNIVIFHIVSQNFIIVRVVVKLLPQVSRLCSLPVDGKLSVRRRARLFTNRLGAQFLDELTDAAVLHPDAMDQIPFSLQIDIFTSLKSECL